MPLCGARACAPGAVIGCVGVTLGASGWRWVQLRAGGAAPDFHRVCDSSVRSSPAPHVRVVDTLSAGDVFHGAFALGVGIQATSGEDTEKSSGRGGASQLSVLQDLEGVGLFASAAAALKCTRFGGRSGCPQRAELMQFLGQWSVWAAYLAGRAAAPGKRDAAAEERRRSAASKL